MGIGLLVWSRIFRRRHPSPARKRCCHGPVLRTEALERRELLSAAASTPWKFLVYGDTRGSGDVGEAEVNDVIVSELARATLTENPAFVLVPGDLVNSGDLAAFQLWRNGDAKYGNMKPVYDVHIPVYPIIGNHDATDVNAFKTVFGPDLPDNGPTGEVDRTYAVTYNNALILGLDEYVNTGRVNQAWVDAQLAARDRAATPHVFAFGHQPAFKANHTDCLDDYPANRDDFWNSLKNAGSRSYFAGHDHFYDHARIGDGDGNTANDLHQFIVGSGGAPLTSTYAYDGANTVWSPANVYHEMQYGYMVVTVDGATVTMTWKDRTGADSYVATPDVFSYTVAGQAPPVANADAALTQVGMPVTVNVLANDSDPNGDPLAVTAVTQGTHGAVVRHEDNTVTYTPVAGFHGSDSFQYTISDGQGGTASATVSVTVNAPPVATADVATTAEDTAVAISVLTNDSDPDGNPLIVTSAAGAAHGTLKVNADNTVTYTPAANYYGSDAFNYTISDGRGGTAGATVAVTVTAVNDAPIAVADAVATKINTSVTFNVLANDRDAENDPLTVIAFTKPAKGTLVSNGGGSFTYTPNQRFQGNDSFTYTISDGHGGTASATVSISVKKKLTAGPRGWLSAAETGPFASVRAAALTHDDSKRAVDVVLENWLEV